MDINVMVNKTILLYVGCDTMVRGVLRWLCGKDEGWLCDISYMYEEEDNDVAVPGWSNL